jgi:hypothetical protein
LSWFLTNGERRTTLRQAQGERDCGDLEDYDDGLIAGFRGACNTFEMNAFASLTGTAFLGFLLAGCTSSEVTETDWTASPNGQWLTRITRLDVAGPGNNALHETVQLKQLSASEPIDILSLDEGRLTGDQLNGPAIIKVRWRDPTHLELNYSGGEVVFQAVKVANLSIETIRAGAQP